MKGAKIHDPIVPMPPVQSPYGPPVDKITMRAYQLPGIVSVRFTDLFPEFPQPIYPDRSGNKNIKIIRELAEDRLRRVDMSMIKSNDSINILGSHHGFTLFGDGAPYAEMLKTIRDIIIERTGAKDIRLRVGVGLRHKEADMWIKYFKLDEYFGKGRARGIAPLDPGIPVDTEIGTLYVLRDAFDAKWIVHAHNSDVREVHFHRHIDRAVKPFAMSYARLETRATYHFNFGPRTANIVARAIFESPFVQSKYTFSSFIVPSPEGIVTVDADNNLYALNNRITLHNFRTYGKIMTLYTKLKDFIVVLDFSGPIPYQFAGGIIFANLSSNVDLFDLDVEFPGYTWYSEMFYDELGHPMSSRINPVHPGMKAIVINLAWGGYPSVFWSQQVPTIIVGEHMAEVLRRDSQNREFLRHAVVADDLPTAMEFAYKFAKTDKVIIFDGAAGGINVSKSLAEEMLELAPKVSEEVDNVRIPKWCKQRGMDCEAIKNSEKYKEWYENIKR
jgi:hypothetical protein